MSRLTGRKAKKAAEAAESQRLNNQTLSKLDVGPGTYQGGGIDELSKITPRPAQMIKTPKSTNYAYKPGDESLVEKPIIKKQPTGNRSQLTTLQEEASDKGSGVSRSNIDRYLDSRLSKEEAGTSGVSPSSHAVNRSQKYEQSNFPKISSSRRNWDEANSLANSQKVDWTNHGAEYSFDRPNNEDDHASGWNIDDYKTEPSAVDKAEQEALASGIPVSRRKWNSTGTTSNKPDYTNMTAEERAKDQPFIAFGDKKFNKADYPNYPNVSKDGTTVMTDAFLNKTKNATQANEDQAAQATSQVKNTDYQNGKVDAENTDQNSDVDFETPPKNNTSTDLSENATETKQEDSLDNKDGDDKGDGKDGGKKKNKGIIPTRTNTTASNTGTTIKPPSAGGGGATPNQTRGLANKNWGLA